MGVSLDKTLNAEIGGYKLPADFKCLSLNFLKSLVDISFEKRIISIYKTVLNKDIDNSYFSSISSSEFPASVYGVDDCVSVLELFDGNSLSYADYLFGKTFDEKVCSLAFTLVSAYVDLCESGKIEFGQKINVASDVSNGLILLALDFAKTIKLPIETLILGVDKPVEDVRKGVYFNAYESAEIDEIINAFFEETDYLFDPISASGLVAYDYYYADYEDGLETLILALNSPYLFARNLLKTLTKINELSVQKAIKKLEEFTAIEIPLAIESGEVQPFYKKSSEICVKDALEIIKG